MNKSVHLWWGGEGAGWDQGRSCPQVNKFKQVQVVVSWGSPPPLLPDKHYWKHYLPATSMVGGKYALICAEHLRFNGLMKDKCSGM